MLLPLLIAVLHLLAVAGALFVCLPRPTKDAKKAGASATSPAKANCPIDATGATTCAGHPQDASNRDDAALATARETQPAPAQQISVAREGLCTLVKPGPLLSLATVPTTTPSSPLAAGSATLADVIQPVPSPPLTVPLPQLAAGSAPSEHLGALVLSAPTDTLTAPSDTLTAPSDTLTAPSDTAAAPSDTAAASSLLLAEATDAKQKSNILADQSWFHGYISTKEALCRIHDKGDFLVRATDLGDNPGFILTAMDEKCTPVHVKLRKDGARWWISRRKEWAPSSCKSPRFDSIFVLVDHYQTNGISHLLKLTKGIVRPAAELPSSKPEQQVSAVPETPGSAPSEHLGTLVVAAHTDTRTAPSDTAVAPSVTHPEPSLPLVEATASKPKTRLLTDQTWYHGFVPRKVAIGRLHDKGDFFVRATDYDEYSPDILLTALDEKNEPIHRTLRTDGSRWWIGRKDGIKHTFGSIVDLVEHCQNNDMMGADVKLRTGVARPERDLPTRAAARARALYLKGIKICDPKPWREADTEMHAKYVDFALKFLAMATASADRERNVVVSPFSLGVSLAILMECARGGTRDEIEKVLGKDVCFYRSLSEFIGEKSDIVSTRSCIALLIEQSLKVGQGFNDEVMKAFGVLVRSMSLRDGAISASAVNKLICDATNGLVADMVSAERCNPTLNSILLTTNVFEGEWVHPFAVKSTKARMFRGLAGDRSESFMHKSECDSRRCVTDEFVAVELLYKDESFSLLLLMPTSGDFIEWRNGLSSTTITAAIARLKGGVFKLSVPKFSIASSINCKAALSRMGVTSCFGPEAQLEGFPDSYVGDVTQKNIFKIDEKDTRAATATVFDETCGFSIVDKHIIHIIFDSPFLFVLLKQKTPLYIGQIV